MTYLTELSEGDYSWVEGNGAAKGVYFYQDSEGFDIAYIRDLNVEAFRYRASYRTMSDGGWCTEEAWVNFDIAKERVAAKALEFKRRGNARL